MRSVDFVIKFNVLRVFEYYWREVYGVLNNSFVTACSCDRLWNSSRGWYRLIRRFPHNNFIDYKDVILINQDSNLYYLLFALTNSKLFKLKIMNTDSYRKVIYLAAHLERSYQFLTVLYNFYQTKRICSITIVPLRSIYPLIKSLQLFVQRLNRKIILNSNKQKNKQYPLRCIWNNFHWGWQKILSKLLKVFSLSIISSWIIWIV